MKIANITFIILFLFAAAVQYNDPDPIQWIAIYTLAAIASILFLVRKQNRIFPAIVGGIALLWAILLILQLFGTSMPIVWGDVFGRADMKTEAVELTREIFGLLIVTGWMSWLAMKSNS